MRRLWLFLLLVGLGNGAVAWSAPPAAPTSFRLVDRPNDAGQGLIARWEPAAEGTPAVARYEIYLRKNEAGAEPGEMEKVAELGPAETKAELLDLEPGVGYLARLVAVGEDEALSEEVLAGPVAPRAEWFNSSRGWLAILLMIVCGAVLAYIVAARRGAALWVRPIAGLAAVTDAVGRAVEMGKKVLFIPGIQDINDIQTVAGVTVLSRVSRIAAEYDAEIMVPTARSLVMATCRETVQASYLQAGRPDSFNVDDIYYLTDEQFGYVAGVTGAMAREEPAACFYMGAFYAESLILAETGNSIGAIQVAGTAQPSQLPFFIAACDYTLIGEEFFAASAYLSGEPQQLGSLKGQDFGKLMGTILIILGCLIAPLGVVAADEALSTGAGWNTAAAEFLKENILGGGGFLPGGSP